MRRKHESAPIFMLEAEAAPGTRTRVHGVRWDGVLNATPDDDPALDLEVRLTINDGPAEIVDVA